MLEIRFLVMIGVYSASGMHSSECCTLTSHTKECTASTLILQVLDRSEQLPNPSPTWISEEAWDNLTILDALAAFKGLASSLESSNGDWELWFRQQEPETAELPREWESKCNELQRMLLVRSLRPDRVIFAATKYVANALGKKFVEPPVLDLGETYADSTALSPLIFVLSAGVDPTAQLRKLAAEKGLSSKLHTVALGQGQVRRLKTLSSRRL